MALKDLEQLTEELKKLTQKLKGEVDRGTRMVLINDIQMIIWKIQKGAQG